MYDEFIYGTFHSKSDYRPEIININENSHYIVTQK